MTYIIPKWLDEKFIERALRECEENDTIVVRKIIVRPATSVGDNFGSDMIRVTAEYNTCRSFKDEVCSKSLIVKALPEDEDMKKAVTEKDAFTTEIEVLHRLIPEFHVLLNAPSARAVTLAPKCYYHSDKPHQKLVMEDLCQSGFKMAEKGQGLDQNQCMLAVSKLGLFHAASIALLQQDPHVFKNFHAHPNLKNRNAMKNLTQFFFKLVAEHLQTLPDADFAYYGKLINLGETVIHRLETAVQRNEKGFNVLNHGDAWKNNMMFKYDEDGKATEVIFVDFQNCYFGSPAIDLHYFLYSSPGADVRSCHLDQLIECYHSSLSKTLTTMGCSEKCPSLDDIHEEIEKRNFIGVLTAFTTMSLLLANSDTATDSKTETDDLSNHMASQLLSAEFIKEIVRLLPIFEKKHWLD